MTMDRPTTGIALMLGFCVVAPMGDAVAKLLSNSVPLAQVVFLRFVVQAILLIPLVWMTGRMWRMQGQVLWLTVLRTLMHIVGIAAMFIALRYLPLADAIAIVFVMPFFSLVLGYLLLGETVGVRRMVGCAVGFLGTLLIIQPSFASAGWPALLPLFVALNFSFFMLIGRKIAKEVDPIGQQAVSGVIAIIMLIPVVLAGTIWPVGPLEIISPDTYQWGLLLGIGAFGTLAHLLMTWALRYAPSTTLAPMQYLEIPFATLLGFLIFQEWPNPLAGLGIMITVAAGLYIILCERAIARRAARQDGGTVLA